MNSPRPRHIVLITTDHMRHDCIRAHGNPAIHTPHLDALVDGGVSFQHAFVQSHCCMPSRASLFTGLYPQQTGVIDNGYALPPDFEPICSRQLAAAGYHTGHIAKLHLQPHTGIDYDPRQHTYGFDVFHGSESLNKADDAYVRYVRRHYPEYRSQVMPSREEARQFERPDQRVVEAPWQATFSGFCAVTSEDYFSLRGFHPQFLHMGLFAPHPPLIPTREAFAPYDGVDLPPPRQGQAEWEDKPDGRLRKLLQWHRDWTPEQFMEYRRYFYAMVTELDLAVGHLVDTLRRRGELDDTLIVFTSDHGDQCGDHHLVLKAPHYYDEVMRVPLVFHWPNGLGQQRRDVPGLVELTDLLPTILGMSGGHPHEALMGRNMAPELLAGKIPEGRSDVFATSGGGLAMLRTPDWKYLRYGPGQEVLYDLNEREAFEMQNLAQCPEHQEVLGQLRDRMLTRSLEAGASPLPRLACW